eukprot:751472-Hanusia_phi.AAC.2
MDVSNALLVHDRHVFHELRKPDELEGGQRLLEAGLSWATAGDDAGLAVASDTVLEHESQLRVPVRHVPVAVGQRHDDVAEGREGAVDTVRLLQTIPCRLREGKQRVRRGGREAESEERRKGSKVDEVEAAVLPRVDPISMGSDLNETRAKGEEGERSTYLQQQRVRRLCRRLDRKGTCPLDKHPSLRVVTDGDAVGAVAEEVGDGLVVDLQVGALAADVHSLRLELLHPGKEEREHPGDQPLRAVILRHTTVVHPLHGESLACPCLAVRKDCAVVPFKNAHAHRLAHGLEDVLLRAIRTYRRRSAPGSSRDSKTDFFWGFTSTQKRLTCLSFSLEGLTLTKTLIPSSDELMVQSAPGG